MKRCPRLSTVLQALESIAPLKYAEASWDNVGLIYEHPFHHTKPLFNIMLALDLTENVIDQAKSLDCSMIIAYHPPWFKGIKRLTQEMGSEARLIGVCAALGISVFSPHTSVDNVNPGVNDWVAEQVFKETIESSCAIVPSTLCEGVGGGRIITLKTPITLSLALQSISTTFNMPTSNPLRYSASRISNMEQNIQTVGICVGSGASLMHTHFAKSSLDFYLTGEMGHHDLLKAINEYGCAVALTEHSTMERAYFFSRFRDKLVSVLGSGNGLDEGYKVFVPKDDYDPVQFYTRDQQ